MSGWLRVVGLGPGPAEWLTGEARACLHEATDLVGYGPYVRALPPSAPGRRHASDNGVEPERARRALELAAGGARVAVVSGGDAGIFGMAATVCEVLEEEPAWRGLDVAVLPGMTALLAAAARVGAPLGHDFCVVSLSDHLKPWSAIERRLLAAVAGDFALALYNPASRGRRQQVERAAALLGPERIAIRATSVGRPEEDVEIATLGELDLGRVDMRTLLLVGSSRTRRVERPGRPPLVYTPRFYEDP